MVVHFCTVQGPRSLGGEPGEAGDDPLFSAESNPLRRVAGPGGTALHGQAGCRILALMSLASVFLFMEVSPQFDSNKQGTGLRQAHAQGPAEEDLAQL